MQLKNLIKSMMIAVPALLMGTNASAHDCCHSHHSHCGVYSCHSRWSCGGYYNYWHSHCHAHYSCYGHHCYANHCNGHHSHCDSGCKDKCSDDSKKDREKDN